MNEDELRAMIRESIARHLGSSPPEQESPWGADVVVQTGDDHRPPLAAHASHFRYALAGSGGPCLIEPAVQCNHCGYCQSHGH